MAFRAFKSLISVLAFLLTIFHITAQEQTVKLKLSESKTGIGGFRQVILNEDGVGEFPFANDAGKVLFKLVGQKVIVDFNGDGKFDGADGESVGIKETFHVPVMINDQKADYAMQFAFIQPKNAFLMNLCRLEGEFKGSKFSLIDQNMNGNFGEIDIDQFQAGDLSMPAPLGSLLSISGEIFNIKSSKNGSNLALTPYQGQKSELNLETDGKCTVRLILSIQNKTISAPASSDKTAMLIPGTYNIIQSVAMFGGRKNPFDNGLYGNGGTLVLKEGKNTVKAGPPLKLEFSAIRSKNDPEDIKIQTAELIGSAGEKYRPSMFGSAKSTLQSFIRSGNKEKELSKLEYG